VTHGENTRRGVSVERVRAYHRARVGCLQGHAYTSDSFFYDWRGYRQCRICRRLRERRERIEGRRP
jgi:hypothetical protein